MMPTEVVTTLKDDGNRMHLAVTLLCMKNTVQVEVVPQSPKDGRVDTQLLKYEKQNL